MLRFVFLSAYNLRTVITENSISIANLILSCYSYFPIMEIVFDVVKKKLEALKQIYFSFGAGAIYQSGSLFLKMASKVFSKGRQYLK